MIASTQYREIEGMLYNYLRNSDRLEELYREYTELSQDLSAQQYQDKRYSAGHVSDAVGDFVHQKIFIEQEIEKLQGKVWPVQRMQERLLRRRVIQGYSRERVQDVLMREYFIHDESIRADPEIRTVKGIIVRLVSESMI